MTETYRLYTGRPEDCADRLLKEQRCYDLLDSLGIAYERVDHPAAMTMADCQAIEAVLGVGICKNLFLCNRQKTDFYLLLLRGEKTFKTKDVSHELGVSRLSFGDGEDMEKFLDITPGSLSILGLMNDREHRVRLLVDSDLLNDDYLCCHPCINTSCLKIRRSDIFDRLLPSLGYDFTKVEIRSFENTPE